MVAPTVKVLSEGALRSGSSLQDIREVTSTDGWSGIKGDPVSRGCLGPRLLHEVFINN